jgi:hypothetical protein
MLHYATYFITALLLCSQVSAAEIRAVNWSKDPGGTLCEIFDDFTVCATLLISGPITKGDNKRLVSVIEQNEALKPTRGGRTRVGVMFFNSPGGDLIEAMEIGRTVRKRLIQTVITADSTCASACLVAFLGGVARWPVGPAVVHSFYSKQFQGLEQFDAASKEYNEIAMHLERYIKEMRVSPELLHQIQSVPHYSSKTLSVRELDQMGILGVDPVWAQLRNSRKAHK